MMFYQWFTKEKSVNVELNYKFAITLYGYSSAYDTLIIKEL